MPEEKEAVNATEAAAAEESVAQTQEAETETATASTEQETTEQVSETSQEQKPQFPTHDEFGVPLVNRVAELRRKLEENVSEEKLAEITRKILAEQGQTQQRKYTLNDIPEIEAWAIENPQYRPQAEALKAQVLLDEQKKVVQQEVSAADQKRTGEIKKQQSFNYVVQTYPELFAKDVLGNLQFNLQHPMMQHINMLMQDKRFANDPEGLMAAADIAYGRYMRNTQSTTQKKIKGLQQNVKKLQKGTLVEGGGQPQPTGTKTAFQKKREQLAKSGSTKDANAAVREYLKQIGQITE